MHFPAESSAEDLAYHRGHAPARHPEVASAPAAPSLPGHPGDGEANTNAQR